MDWVKKSEEETDDEYAERVFRTSEAGGLGAARGWRSLGVRRARREDEDTGERVWTLDGIPRRASNADIVSWADEGGLKQAQLIETSTKLKTKPAARETA